MENTAVSNPPPDSDPTLVGAVVVVISCNVTLEATNPVVSILCTGTTRRQQRAS